MKDIEIEGLEARLRKEENNRRAAETKLGRLEDLFTTEQRRHRYSDANRLQWKCDETLVSSLELRYAGPKAYRLMLARGWPLPSIRTLQRFTARLEINVGFIQPVLQWFRDNPRVGKDRYCIYEYDEMSTRADPEYDIGQSMVVPEASRAQLVIVRGLFGKWKHAVYVDFDFNMTAEKVLEIATTLHGVGLLPCATVADLGGSNQKVWTSLNISEEKPYFDYPIVVEEAEGKKPEVIQNFRVFVFADPPHMMKLARNHLIDVGYKLSEDLGTASIEPVRKLIEIQKGTDLRLCPRLKASDVMAKNSGNRMKVSSAAHLMSNTVSGGLFLLTKRTDLMPSDTEQTAYLLKMFNDWCVINLTYYYNLSYKYTYYLQV